tara:strand:+ start:364 stop:633 length:270 start_codon:yes stop_codon:yes gene_type:complete
MKAEIIKANGDREFTEPENQRDFKLGELQEIVGGYIEITETNDNRLMIISEEGKLRKLPTNGLATALYKYGKKDVIVGDVVVINKNQIR